MESKGQALASHTSKTSGLPIFNYPQLHNDFKLIIYNIPDINEINDNFITLLDQTIKHQKKAAKNNIMLNINSNLQHNPKVLQLQGLLGGCIVSGDLNTELTSINFVWNKTLVIGSLAVFFGFLYYIIKKPIS